jgi:hypothetical protein
MIGPLLGPDLQEMIEEDGPVKTQRTAKDARVGERRTDFLPHACVDVRVRDAGNWQDAVVHPELHHRLGRVVVELVVDRQLWRRSDQHVKPRFQPFYFWSECAFGKRANSHGETPWCVTTSTQGYNVGDRSIKSLSHVPGELL